MALTPFKSKRGQGDKKHCFARLRLVNAMPNWGILATFKSTANHSGQLRLAHRSLSLADAHDDNRP